MGGVLVDDLAFDIVGMALEDTVYDLLGVGESALVVGVVAAPEKGLVTHVVQGAEGDGIVAEGDVALASEVITGLEVQLGLDPHVLALVLLVQGVEVPGQPTGAALHDDEVEVGVTHGHAGAEEQGSGADALSHGDYHVGQKAAVTLFAGVLGEMVLGAGDEVEAEDEAGVLQGVPERLVDRQVVGLVLYADGGADQAEAFPGQAIHLIHRLGHVDGGEDGGGGKAVGTGAELLVNPVVVCSGGGHLEVAVGGGHETEEGVAVDDLRNHVVALLVLKTAGYVPTTAGVVSKLAVLVVVGDARLGDVDAAGLAAFYDGVDAAVPVLAVRETVTVLLGYSLEKIVVLVDVGVGRDVLQSVGEGVHVCLSREGCRGLYRILAMAECMGGPSLPRAVHSRKVGLIRLTRSLEVTGLKVHLIDGTYELFRSYFAMPSLGAPDGREVGAVRGFIQSTLALLRTRNVTHVGCAFDHEITSFRNEMFAGYKTGEGVAEELLTQFPLAEEAAAALGVVVWPMIEFEADDAIATAAAKVLEHPEVEQVVICTPDKDLTQMVQGERAVCLDRRKDAIIDEAAVEAKFGVSPESIPDYLALVGDAADGIPGIARWGAKSTAQALQRYERIEDMPLEIADWDVKIRGLATMVRNLATGYEDALLYKRLATLRTDVPLREVWRTWNGGG